MITRLAIKNYRNTADLELSLESLNLLMGRNGSGKSTVFDVLAGIRELLIDGKRCEEVFPLTTVPRWLATDTPFTSQQFEIEALSPWGRMRYRIIIAQAKMEGQSRIALEQLLLENDRLFFFSNGKVHLYRDDFTEIPEYAADWNRSAMAAVPSQEGINSKLTWFKERISRIYCIGINAGGMVSRSEKSEAAPSRTLSNFASWYRQAFLADTAAGSQYTEAIKKVFDGMKALNLRLVGQGIAILNLKMKLDPDSGVPNFPPALKEYELEFHELSDGQRALIGLYALIHFLIRENATLCIDEPDGFVALSELQPWLNSLIDLVDEHNGQVLLASHHPEMYNLLAAQHGLVFARKGAGPTTVDRYHGDPDSPLAPAELIARGRYA